jgi:predicted phage terminase large subunit-like protein
MKLNPNQQAYFALVKSDFGAFVQQAFATQYPRQQLRWNWHLDAIINELEQNLSGLHPQLLITMPPRHLKTFLVSICWPAFLLTKDPSLKIFCVSYSEELAKAIGRDFRRLVESAWYTALFPDVRMTKLTETEVATSVGGFRSALSVHGSITGRGADLIIVDDPSRPEEAESDTARLKLNAWFNSTLLSRRDDKLRSGLIIVMQRLHVNDLAGFVEETGNWRTLSLAAIAKRDERIELRNGETYLRREGEALQPDRESVDTLRQLERQIGPFLFAAQYQQSLRTPDGTLFKRKNFVRVDKLPQPKGPGEFFISIDSAMSRSATADYTAIIVVYIADRRLYVLKVERGRFSYEELRNRTLRWIERLGECREAITVIVENSSSGVWLLQELKDRRIQRINLQGFRPRTDKYDRAARVRHLFDPGICVYDVNGQNDWVEKFIHEFMNFPNGANDDQVDALIQLLHTNRARNLLLDFGSGGFIC